MRHALLAGAGLLLVFCGTAHAEIGRASAGPGEWFLGFGLGGAATWGAKRQAAQQGTQIDQPFHDLDYDDGTILTGGVEVGHVLADPSWLFDRMELNIDLSTVLRDVNEVGHAASLAQVGHGRAVTAAFGSDSPDGVEVEGDDTQLDVETRLSFKSTLADDGARVVIGSLEPFFRYQDTKGDTDIRFAEFLGESSTLGREDSVEAYYVGLQVAAELEQPITESLDLVGRISAGAYYVDSDIEDRLYVSTVGQKFGTEDSDDALGGRFGAALGFKAPLYAEGVTFTIIGTVDYYTDVATIEHADASGGRTRADFDDRLDAGGRIGLVFPIR